jgi:hypothetical protein
VTAGIVTMQKKSKKLPIPSFWNFIKTGSINTVSFVPLLLAIALVLLWVGVKNALGIKPEIFNYAILFIASMLLGSTGLIYIYRKEMPGPVSSVTIRGGCAVFAGYLMLVFFWALGIAGIAFAIME